MRRLKLWLLKWIYSQAAREARLQEHTRCENIALVEALARKITGDFNGSDAAGEILWRIRQCQTVDERDAATARVLEDKSELFLTSR